MATVLLGVCAGHWLRNGKIAVLSTAGVAAVLLGWAWQYALPFNKALWTPSYALWAGGWSMLALVLGYTLVERRGWPALGRRFGVNAISLYVASILFGYVLSLTGVRNAVFTSLIRYVEPQQASLLFSILLLGSCWLMAYLMDKKRWYIKV